MKTKITKKINKKITFRGIRRAIFLRGTRNKMTSSSIGKEHKKHQVRFNMVKINEK
jgi:hypothetical protein